MLIKTTFLLNAFFCSLKVVCTQFSTHVKLAARSFSLTKSWLRSFVRNLMLAARNFLPRKQQKAH